MACLEFNNLTENRVDLHFLNKIFKIYLATCKLPLNSQVSLAIVDSQTIRRLNRKYRGKNSVTDVLSFAEGEINHKFPNYKENNYLGEVVICYSVAKKQASEQNHSIKKEIMILFIHGLLHLIGYEHQTKKEAKKMRRLEQKILENS